MPQHPDPSPVCGTQVGQRFMVIPTTSCPSATSRAAATALSTPPLIATAIRAMPLSGPPFERVPLHALPPCSETAPEFGLVSTRRGFVIGSVLHVVGHVLLGDEPAGVIVWVLVPAAVPEARRSGIGGVPQGAGNGPGLIVLDVMPRPRDGGDRRIALRRRRQVDHG